MDAARSGRTRRLTTALLLALVLAGVAASYSRVLDGGRIFDDVSIWNEPDRRLDSLSLEGLRRASQDMAVESSRRVTNLTFALNFLWFGSGTLSFHAVNIAIHALAALALFGFVNQSARLAGRSADSALRIALVAAAFFALNPVQTQAVSYMWQRAASLVGLICLTAMWLLARGLAGRRGVRAACWLAAALLVPIAAFTKQNGAMLSVLMVLFLWLFATDRSPRSMLRAGLVLAGVTALMFLVIAPVWFRTLDLAAIVEGTIFPSSEIAGSRLLTQSRVAMRLASLALLPLPSRLNFAHGVGPSSGFFEPWTTAASVLAIVALVVAALAVAPRRPLVSLGILWYFVLLVPESAMPQLATMFEHRVYLPGAGLALLVALGVEWLGFGPRGHPRLVALVASIALAALAAGTWVRNEVWTSSVSLWSDVAAKNPDSTRALWYLAGAWEDRAGELPPKTPRREAALDRAEEVYERALALRPGDVPFSNSLARLRLERGRWAREHPDAAANPLPPVFVAIEPTVNHARYAPDDVLPSLDGILSAAIASWGALSPDRFGGTPPTAARLAEGGILGFQTESAVTSVRLYERADGDVIECRFRVRVRRWHGADVGPRGRRATLTLRERTPVLAGEGSEAARRCLRNAAKKGAEQHTLATLQRLTWLWQHFPELRG